MFKLILVVLLLPSICQAQSSGKLSGYVRITTGAAQIGYISNTTFTVVESTVGVVQVGAWTVSATPSYLTYSESTFKPLFISTATYAPAQPLIRTLRSYLVPSGKTLKIYGYKYRSAGSGVYLGLYARKSMWYFSNTKILNMPPITVKVATTISGAGMTPTSTYRYIYTPVSAVGKSSSSIEMAVVLPSTCNAVSMNLPNIAGTKYFEVYRTAAGGGTGTEKYLVSIAVQNEGAVTSFIDTIPDAQLGLDTFPTVNSSSQSIDGSAYPDGYAPSHIQAEIQIAPTVSKNVGYIYKDSYGKQRYALFTTGIALGAVPLYSNGEGEMWSGVIGSYGKIPVEDGKEYLSGGITDILAIDNVTLNGSFVINGYTPLLFGVTTAVGNGTDIMFPYPIAIPSGTELVIAISANTAITSLTSHTMSIKAVLE